MDPIQDPNIKMVYKTHKCPFCNFKTHKTYNLDVHKRNKPGSASKELPTATPNDWYDVKKTGKKI